MCVCVQVAHMLLEWRWEGRNKEGIEVEVGLRE